MARRFNDRLTHPLPTARDLFRIMVLKGGFRPDAKGLAQGSRVPRAPNPGVPKLKAKESAVTWIGHASFLLQLQGVNILTDPVWSQRLPGRIGRVHPPGIPWEALPKIDGIVISHNHYDHLDAATVERLPRDVHCFVPLGLARWFKRRSFTNVYELDWWQSAKLGKVELAFVPSHHWSRRTPWDTNTSLWGGWVFTPPGGRRVYFAGDTGYGHWFNQIGLRLPGIETALLPIGAYAPRWFMKPVHTDPDEAVQALADLGARRLVTMHWGTFPLTQEPIMEPLTRIRAAWKKSGRPRNDLWDLALGGSRKF